MLHSVISELSRIVGPAHVLSDPDSRRGFEQDWTGRVGRPALAVVRPGDREQVQRVLQACSAQGVSVVTQGGNTGLVGGGVPTRQDQIILSTRRLNEITDADPTALQITAQAGCTVGQWQAAARAVGCDGPLDFAARDSATIGGAIATNAGGSRVVRFGTMRRQVVGIEAVLADGSVVGSLAGLPKEACGIHWPSLLTGSEGTLAVVTAARLRMVPHFSHTATAMVSLGSIADALPLLASARRLSSLDSIEIMLGRAARRVASYRRRALPVATDDDGCVVTVECADHTDPWEQLADVVGDAPGVRDSAVATDSSARHEMVAFREQVPEAIAAASTALGMPVVKLDVAVPVEHLPDLFAMAARAANDHSAELMAFGHLAEGNLHLNYVGAPDPQGLSERVLTAVADMGGAISAEHGIGVAKSAWMPLVRSDSDRAAQHAIRHALDPGGVLNPDVLADPGHGTLSTG